jgi:hypothetical protein
MKYVLVLVWLCMAMIGFGQALQEGFEVYERSALTYDTARMGYHKAFGIVEGESTVFVWTSNNKGEEGNDSEAQTTFAFAVPNAGGSFELDAASIDGVYVQQCRCADRGVQRITSGKLIGYQHYDRSWSVEIDAIVVGNTSGKTYWFKRAVKFIPNL